jgi:hypothetical protein
LLDGKAKKLTKLAVERAEAGDMTALRLCLERIVPVRKERPTPFRLPPISGPADLPGIATSVVEAVADGSLTLGEGERICSMLDAMRGLYETADLAAQVDAMRADVEALRAQTQDWQER